MHPMHPTNIYIYICDTCSNVHRRVQCKIASLIIIVANEFQSSIHMPVPGISVQFIKPIDFDFNTNLFHSFNASRIFRLFDLRFTVNENNANRNISLEIMRNCILRMMREQLRTKWRNGFVLHSGILFFFFSFLFSNGRMKISRE